jgi:hypothetical protein
MVAQYPRFPVTVTTSVLAARPRDREDPGRLSQLGEQHDGDQGPDHARRGRCSRSGDELRDASEGGDDHRRNEAHGDRRA